MRRGASLEAFDPTKLTLNRGGPYNNPFPAEKYGTYLDRKVVVKCDHASWAVKRLPKVVEVSLHSVVHICALEFY